MRGSTETAKEVPSLNANLKSATAFSSSSHITLPQHPLAGSGPVISLGWTLWRLDWMDWIWMEWIKPRRRSGLTGSEASVQPIHPYTTIHGCSDVVGLGW